MSGSERSRKTRRIVVYSMTSIFFSILIAGIVYGLQPMILPFIIGAFLAYLFKPLANSFRGPAITKYIRAGALLFFVGSITYWGTTFIKASLPNEREKLQLKVRLQYRLNERYLSLMNLADGGKGNFIYKTLGQEFDELKKRVIDYVKMSDDERKRFLILQKEISDSDHENKKYYEYYLANLKNQKVDIEKLKSLAGSAIVAIEKPAGDDIGNLANIMRALSHWIILPLAFIFILLDKGQIFHFFLRLIPNRYFELAYTVAEKVDDALGKYIRGTMLECLLVGLTLFIGLFISGVELKMAIIIGMVGGLTNAIPFVGTFIACIMGVFYSLIAENVHSFLPFINENNLMIAVLAVVVIAHLLDNAIYQPLVVGSAVNIHPLVVILSVFGGSLMFGFAGMIFAIPTIVIIKVVTETLFAGLKDYRII
ncbi:MAG: hypothetical protein A2Z20_07720 [Bdellovibrionales bacterium RBG_16_40_8]|nr:MAG: hypothetical protein A2Z20_07720 [Bdellovibrionales bacterium RBG_16_40_8]